MGQIAKNPKNILKCECGCSMSGSRFRMHEVKCTYFERSGKELRESVGRRFLVLPEHEKPFQRELNGWAALRNLVKRFERKPWYVRLRAVDAVYQAQFFIDRRHHGYWKTISYALKSTIMFASPDWLAVLFAERWRRRISGPASPSAPRAGRGLPSVTSPKPC